MLQFDLRSMEPVSSLSGYYELPETHGTLDGLLVDEKATMPTDGGADSLMLHIDF